MHRTSPDHAVRGLGYRARSGFRNGGIAARGVVLVRVMTVMLAFCHWLILRPRIGQAQRWRLTLCQGQEAGFSLVGGAAVERLKIRARALGPEHRLAAGQRAATQLDRRMKLEALDGFRIDVACPERRGPFGVPGLPAFGGPKIGPVRLPVAVFGPKAGAGPCRMAAGPFAGEVPLQPAKEGASSW